MEFKTRPSGHLHSPGRMHVAADAPALLHEIFPMIQEAFPDATPLDLFGASIVFDFEANTTTVRCGGKEKVL